MIGLLMGLGLGKRAAQVVAFVVIPLLILGAFYLMLDAYGDSRYDAGEADTRAEYKAASERLKQEAAASASRADDAAALRLEGHMEQVQEEQERLDEAQRTGSSPLDVLFGG